MDSPDPLFDLSDLCAKAGVTARTVRYYVQQGLLPQPGAGREARKYGAGHLNRLRLIRHLQREHLPLTEIRQRLAGLSDDEVAERLEPQARSSAAAPTARAYLDQLLGPRTAATPPVSASRRSVADPDAHHSPRLEDPVRAATPSSVLPASEPSPAATDNWPQAREQWERLTLHDDVELNIRRPTSRDMNRRIERLLEIARRILHDD